VCERWQWCPGFADASSESAGLQQLFRIANSHFDAFLGLLISLWF
jgi:hypothetical protein